MRFRRNTDNGELQGFLDHQTSLTGELSYSGTLRIDGNVHGSISTNDCLIVGERATIHADVKAGEVRIYGSVFGNVEGVRKIEIASTGLLRGDARTASLVIDEGGAFLGRSRNFDRTEDGDAPAPDGASAVDADTA